MANGIDVAIIVVAVALGCILTYVSLLRAFSRGVAELRGETERRLNLLSNALKALEAQVAEKTAVLQPVAVPEEIAKVGVAASRAQAEIPQPEQVSPEILVVIAAAVTTFLGKKVRIRSAKMLQSPYEIVNPWSQQGRVFVQASHNLRSR
jgi:hypothetical protein